MRRRGGTISRAARRMTSALFFCVCEWSARSRGLVDRSIILDIPFTAALLDSTRAYLPFFFLLRND